MCPKGANALSDLLQQNLVWGKESQVRIFIAKLTIVAFKNVAYCSKNSKKSHFLV